MKSGGWNDEEIDLSQNLINTPDKAYAAGL